MGRVGLVVGFKMTLFWVILLIKIVPLLGSMEPAAEDGDWDAAPISGEEFIRYWLESPQIFDDDPPNWTNERSAANIADMTWRFVRVVGDDDNGSPSKTRDAFAYATVNGEVNKRVDAKRMEAIEDVEKKRQQRDARAWSSRVRQTSVPSRTISSENILLLSLDEDVDKLKQDQKNEVIRSLASILDLPPSHAHISYEESQGHLLAIYFVKRDASNPWSTDPTDLIPASEVDQLMASQNLDSMLESLTVYDLFSQERLMRDVMIQSIFTEPFFPYLIATVSVVLICLLAIVIWCCVRHNRHKKKDSLLHSGTKHPSSGITQQISVLYPTAKPSVGSATGIQPDVTHILTSRMAAFSGLSSTAPGPYASSRGLGSPFSGSGSGAGTPGYSSGSQSGTPILGTPVHTPPLRLKKGLLERRGSNASLTIDLGTAPSTDQTPVGSPPRESTAEEYLQSASRRMTSAKLRQCLKDPKSIYEEFWEIPMNHADKIEVAGSGMKNRYRTIIPNEHSRVKLAERKQDPLTGYINANYIRGYTSEPNVYIATQGPMSNTVNDFWRMVWQEKAPTIIMITKLREKSRTKCENYIPEHFGTYDDLDVHVNSVSEKEGYTLRQLTIKYLNEEHKLFHYWYMAWPDHKAPSTARQLLHLVLEVERERVQESRSSKGPIIVHCSAGIGRTGCFIATSIGLQQLRTESEVDILSTVAQMRLDRGGMVQTNEQYEFVHQALSLYQENVEEESEISSDHS